MLSCRLKGMRIHGTLALEANDEVLIKRIVERGKVSGRADDQDEEKIKKSFRRIQRKDCSAYRLLQSTRQISRYRWYWYSRGNYGTLI